MSLIGATWIFQSEGKTLRENLGLPRPENQFFPAASHKAAE